MSEFFKTSMGRHFYEGTMPRLANALEKIGKIADDFMKETDETKKDEVKDLSQFKDPYVNLEIPDTDFTVEVKLEGEGVVVNVFLTSSLNDLEPQTVASVWKLYDEMETGESAGDDDEKEEDK
jgi:hypothetical protein